MLKDIVVHLTGSDEDQTRIDHAAAVARQFDAHLTGLQVHILPELLSITDPTGSSFLQKLIADSIERAQATSGQLRQSMSALGLSHELRRLDLYPNEAGPALAGQARSCDLFVGTRPYGDPARGEYIEEAVLFGSGRGCLFVPPKLAAPASYDTVFIAWKSTREAAHAVAEALPFLRRAKQVIVGVVEEPDARWSAQDEPGVDIGRHLMRHDIGAEVRLIKGTPEPSEALLNEIKRARADLVVMGAYGHSRFREWMAGGVTRRLLGECPVPVLVAH